MARLTSLNDFLDQAQLDALQPLWITSVDDLLGALEADESSVGNLLGLDAVQVEQLHERLLAATSEDVRAAIEREREHPRTYGAVEPD